MALLFYAGEELCLASELQKRAPVVEREVYDLVDRGDEVRAIGEVPLLVERRYASSVSGPISTASSAIFPMRAPFV